MDEEVPVERREGDEIWVLSAAPIRRDEIVELDLSDRDGAERHRLRVVESQPVLVDGVMRHRVRLTVLSSKSIARGTRARSIRRTQVGEVDEERDRNG